MLLSPLRLPRVAIFVAALSALGLGASSHAQYPELPPPFPSRGVVRGKSGSTWFPNTERAYIELRYRRNGRDVVASFINEEDLKTNSYAKIEYSYAGSQFTETREGPGRGSTPDIIREEKRNGQSVGRVYLHVEPVHGGRTERTGLIEAVNNDKVGDNYRFNALGGVFLHTQDGLRGNVGEAWSREIAMAIGKAAEGGKLRALRWLVNNETAGGRDNIFYSKHPVLAKERLQLNLDTTLQGGQTALMLALGHAAGTKRETNGTLVVDSKEEINDQVGAVDFLLQQGADPNVPSDNKEVALTRALSTPGFTPEIRTVLLKRLLQAPRKANPNYGEGTNGVTALQLVLENETYTAAQKQEMAYALLDASANPDQKDTSGNSARSVNAKNRGRAGPIDLDALIVQIKARDAGLPANGVAAPGGATSAPAHGSGARSKSSAE